MLLSIHLSLCHISSSSSSPAFFFSLSSSPLLLVVLLVLVLVLTCDRIDMLRKLFYEGRDRFG